MLSAALSAWANLLIGWENPHRGSYWSLQPPITAAGGNTTVQGYSRLLNTRSILWPRVTLRSHDSVLVVNRCWLVLFSQSSCSTLTWSVPFWLSSTWSLMLICFTNVSRDEGTATYEWAAYKFVCTQTQTTSSKRSRSCCFGPQLSLITVFTPPQTNRTKGETSQRSIQPN